MGPQLMVRGASEEITKLTGPEPEEVFDAIRGRILQDDNFTAKPKGVDGLVRLVDSHPALQRRLLEFVRELPADRIDSLGCIELGNLLPRRRHRGRVPGRPSQLEFSRPRTAAFSGPRRAS